MTQKGKKISRYPGIRAFEKNERHLFFGRRTEAKKLFSQVKAKPLVVLFAKSGIGKSSLLNAGLEPLLEKDYYQTVNIRLQNTSVDPIETVKNELKPYLNEKKLQTHAPGATGLWELLRACEFTRNGETVVPVLVFDQFEEFFEHPSERQEILTQELSDLVNDRLPDRIRASLREIPFKERTPEQLAWHSPVANKIILAIRSDRMSKLDRMAGKIQSILHNRFHLKPLNIAAAEDAIVEPAHLQDERFETAPFDYDRKALDTILDYLKNKNNEIESFQLQLLCQKIERKIKVKNTPNAIVKESDFGGAKGIKSILNNYYEEEMEELSDAERGLAQTFVEEGLILNGRRVGVNEGVEQQNFGITPDLLSKLLASRLIRAENTHLGRSYELSHDTLVAPIMVSFQKRKEKERQAEAELKQIAQEERIKQEQKKRQQAFSLAALGFFLFFIAMIGGFYAWRQSGIADKARAQAVKERSKAERAREVAVKANQEARRTLSALQQTQVEMAHTYMENGKSNMRLGEYKQAVENFDFVLDLKKVIGDSAENIQRVYFLADSLKNISINAGGAKKQFDSLIDQGDAAFLREAYLASLKNFQKARALNLNTTANKQARLKEEEARGKLRPLFIREVERANIFKEADGCSDALKAVRRAQTIAPYLNQRAIKKELQALKKIQKSCQ